MDQSTWKEKDRAEEVRKMIKSATAVKGNMHPWAVGSKRKSVMRVD